MIPLKPMPSPRPVSASASSVAVGHHIPPIERIRLFSDSQWEDFVLEWADSLRKRYQCVERCGGAGDIGRDVIATAQVVNGVAIWDNYQCKHYNHPLRPSDIWIELGKLVYYTYIKEYTLPRKYYFIAPQGVGTELSNLLRYPARLYESLLKNWGKYCTNKITQKSQVSLDAKLKKYEGINNRTLI